MNAFGARHESRTLYDVVSPRDVVVTLEQSIAVCLAAAAERDGVVLSAEQITRFARECARNAAQTVLAMKVTR